MFRSIVSTQQKLSQCSALSESKQKFQLSRLKIQVAENFRRGSQRQSWQSSTFFYGHYRHNLEILVNFRRGPHWPASGNATRREFARQLRVAGTSLKTIDLKKQGPKGRATFNYSIRGIFL